MARMHRSSSRKARLSDRDMLMDLLVTQKYMSHFYEHAIMESSSSLVRDTLEAFQQDEHELGRILFNTMEERSWYSVSPNNERSSRMQRPRRFKQSQETFDLSANSTYGITSGSRRFGSRLREHTGPSSKSGISTDQQPSQ